MKRAAGQLANFKDERLFNEASEGITLIVENAIKLDDAARCLHEGGNFRASAIMRGLAGEEAAKTLILIDLVRCPRAFHGRVEVAKRFYGHVAKRIYAMTCEYPSIWTFEELSKLVEAESKPFFLDGPNWVDWVFINSMVAEREQELYVDFVQPIAPQQGKTYWIAPLEPSPAPQHYETPHCVTLTHALSELGMKTVEGLSALAGIWRAFTPSPQTKREEIYRLNRRTLEELRRRRPNTDANEAAERFITRFWSFPMWPLEMEEPQPQRQPDAHRDLLAERERTITWIETIEAKRDPPPAISREKVEELCRAYAAWEKEADDLAGENAPEHGLRIITSEVMEQRLTLPSLKRVRELHRTLSQAEKASLLALAWFARESAPADWPSIHHRAESMARTLPEHYQIHHGRHWRRGLDRWERKPRSFRPGRLPAPTR